MCTDAFSVQVYPTAASGFEFELPLPFTTAAVCQRFKDAVFKSEQPCGVAARKWLDDRGFNARAPPALMFAMWAHQVPGGMDVMGRVSYDRLHAFDIGLLKYFLDIVILSMLNSHEATQRGYDAVALFEARLSALPAHNVGYRFYRAYPGGCVRRAINSGNDLFFLLLLFVAAIGFDDKVVKKKSVRVLILSAIEAAAVLAFLLRAEALTEAGRCEAFTAARRFLELLMHDEFRSRQKSEWAIYKFHLLFHIINWLSRGRGAPGCTDSGAFEAALKLYVTSLASHASSHHDIQRDIATHATDLVVDTLLRAAGGPAADALNAAGTRPVRNRQTLDAAVGSREVFVKAAKKPAADVLVAIHDAWVGAAVDLGAAPGAAAAIATTAQWFQYGRLSRPERRFHAPVGLGALVNYSAAADATCYDPARAALGRVVSFFYLPPPQAGAQGDGLPVVAPQAGAALPAGGEIRTERMFAVVWPLLGQRPADATTLGGHGLRWHAIRRPAPRVPLQGLGLVTRLPLQIVPLARVLCGVRAFPADWPILIGHASAFQRYGANYPEAVNAHRIEWAACRGLEQAALVFFPPTRDTFLPSNAPPAPVPAVAGPGRAEEEGDEEDEEVEELGGV